MSQPCGTEQHALSFVERIDRICAPFEAACKAAVKGGPWPSIEDCLGDFAGPERGALVRELVLLDALYRQRRGEQPKAEDYQTRFPELEPAWLARALVQPSALPEPPMVSAAPAARESGLPHTPDSTQAALPGLGSPEDSTIPRRLGDYRILREVGHGGMGVVYEAIQESLGRHVALKVLPLHSLLGRTHLERFRREARAAAKLHHTNIVPVFGVGEHQGVHYYAMQYIDGRGLDLVLRELKRLRRVQGATGAGRQNLAADVAENLMSGHFSHSLPKMEGLSGEPAAHISAGQTDLMSRSDTEYFRGIARLGLQVAEALEYAHRHGILHRDIKPSNLLLDTAGTVWITDFGLAKGTEGEELTRPGDILGTLRYMAPERFRGESDPRGDIYSLGLTLYELVTLRPAFDDGDQTRLIERVQQELPPPPRQIDRRIPRDLETVVLKAMAKEASDRYATAETLAEDLRRFLADRPILARRISLVEQLWRWCRRNRAVAGLMAIAVLLLLIIAVGASVANVVLGTQLRLTADARQDATDKLWESYVAFAQAQRQTKQTERRFTSLEALAKAATIRTDLRLRNEIIACLPLIDLHMVRQWDTDSLIRYEVGFDAALERFAFSDLQGNVSIRRLDDNVQIRQIPGQGGPVYASPLFSPDGRLLAVPVTGRENVCRVYDLRDGREAIPKVASGDPAGCRDFSPDSRWLALGQPDGSIRLFDLTTGQERRLSNVAVPDQIVFHPEGHQLALSSVVGRQAQIVDLESGQVVATFRHEEATRGIAWSHAGRYLALGCDSRVFVYNAREQRLLTVLEDHTAPVIHLAFSSTGLLASTGWDHTTRLWDPATGRMLLTSPNICVRFSRDGRQLAFSDGNRQVGLWEVAEGRECRTLRHGEFGNRSPSAGPQRFCGVDFSPDGQLFASTGSDGVRLWSVAEAREVAQLTLGPTETALFDPRGTSIITCGRSPLRHWPIQRGSSGGQLKESDRLADFQIGPSCLLMVPADPSIHSACWSKDGHRLAVVDGRKNVALVLDVEKPAERTVLEHPRVLSVALSPDGIWAATSSGSARGKEVRVWNLKTGKLEQQLPLQSIGDTRELVTFSPDSRWLVVASESDYHLWHVDTWQLNRVISRDYFVPSIPAAFSPDSRILAIARSAEQIQLWDLVKGEEIASFSAPDPLEISSLRFSPDGSMLAAGTLNQVIQLWDLRRIRQGLKELGHDWDLPFPPEPTQAAIPKVHVTVLAGGSAIEARVQPSPSREELRKRIEDLDRKIATEPPAADLFSERAWRYTQLKEYAKAITDYQKAVELNRDHVLACNNLAWIFTKGPLELRAPEKALPLAQKATRLAPDVRAIHNNLGVVYYRLGQYDGAIPVLERAIEINKGQATAFELFFLAMSHHQLGQGARARDCQERALKWMAEPSFPLTARQLEELKAYRAEAEALLARSTKPNR